MTKIPQYFSTNKKVSLKEQYNNLDTLYNALYKEKCQIESELKEKKLECLKYKQTLQEIKKIAEKEFNKKFKDKTCFDCDGSFKQILEKIIEVLDERN